MRTRQMMAIVALGLAVAGFGALNARDISMQAVPMAEIQTTWHWTSPPQRLGEAGPFQPLLDHLAPWR